MQEVLGTLDDVALWRAPRATLAASRKPPAFLDGQIAAVAAVNHLVLVTRNVSDYRDSTGLQVENWFSG